NSEKFADGVVVFWLTAVMHYSRMQSKAGKGHAPLYLNVRIKVRGMKAVFPFLFDDTPPR
ncbi:hypothetical protein KU710_23885, partial [Salmonella enterica subsp. enterica serovar Give]|nr:hypothetical protein [Salmonella enterica subsp. enterica serovar Give]